MNSRMRSPADLSAEQEGDVEFHVGRFKRLALGGVDGADDVADALRRLEHGRRVHQRFVLAGFRIVVAFGQDADDGLADGQIAGGSDRHDALAGVVEDMQLAEGGDVVDAGIGARVGEHHQPLAHQNSAAIGHRSARSRGDLYTGSIGLRQWRRLAPNRRLLIDLDRDRQASPRRCRSACRGPARRRAHRARRRRAHRLRSGRRSWPDRSRPSRAGHVGFRPGVTGRCPASPSAHK